jgi:hypothetical protein
MPRPLPGEATEAQSRGLTRVGRPSQVTPALAHRLPAACPLASTPVWFGCVDGPGRRPGARLPWRSDEVGPHRPYDLPIQAQACRSHPELPAPHLRRMGRCERRPGPQGGTAPLAVPSCCDWPCPWTDSTHSLSHSSDVACSGWAATALTAAAARREPAAIITIFRCVTKSSWSQGEVEGRPTWSGRV